MPEPCRPAIRITVGPAVGDRQLACRCRPSGSASSSLTIFTTCWPGSRLSSTSAPRQRSFSVFVNALTTLKLTSASSSARRISRIAESMSDSLSLPRERTSERVDCRRSESWSNIGSRLARGYSASKAAAYSAGSNGRRSSSCLPDPDQLHRDAQFGGDRQRDAALRGAVELGQDDAVDLGGLGEDLRLAQPVLAGGRVDRDQRLVRRARGSAWRSPGAPWRAPPSGCPGVWRRPAVSTITTSASRAHGGGDRVVGDRAGVGAGLAADQLGAGAVGPLGELLGGGGAVGVAGGHHAPRGRIPSTGARRSCRSSSSCRCR